MDLGHMVARGDNTYVMAGSGLVQPDVRLNEVEADIIRLSDQIRDLLDD